MSDKKGGRATLSPKQKQQFNDHLYIPDEHLLLIYHAEFYSHYLLLCLKSTVLVYDLNAKNIFRENRASTHIATFIPNTQYIALATSDRQGRRFILQIWNYQKDSIDSRVTFTFQIQTMKASHRCLIFSSLSSLYVVHFPSLKAIFNGRAGNGFYTVYDISKEGLTLVYSTDVKGEVCVRNFTNGETNRCIAQIRSSSYQISERLRMRQTGRRLSRSVVEEEEEVKQEIHIKAHHENISILRLSPNGYRFVSGSTKGTVLRLYSCLNGQLMSEFQGCHVLTTIVDVNFIPEGSAIVCLNNENHVRLFHTKMSEEEVICESVRRGREVYEQDNPKSWFSFLGFLKEEWKYEQPFSYFNLQKLSTKEPVKETGKLRVQSISMSYIKQQQHQKESHDVHGSENQQPSALRSFHSEEVHMDEVPISEILNGTVHSSEKSSSLGHSHSNSEISIKRGKSIQANSNFLKKKSSHNQSIKTIVKRQPETILMNRERMLNFRGTIMFENHISLRVFKGRFYYQLKYDPFNGGEMMNKQPKLNILDVLTARGF